MNIPESIIDIFEALERSKLNASRDQGDLAQNDKMMIEVFELSYDLKQLGDHLGISVEQFPKLEALEDDEVKILVDQILETWSVYNYFADLPEGLPIRIAYEILISLWHDEVPRMPEGQFHFDFHDLELEKYIKKQS